MIMEQVPSWSFYMFFFISFISIIYTYTQLSRTPLTLRVALDLFTLLHSMLLFRYLGILWVTYFRNNQPSVMKFPVIDNCIEIGLCGEPLESHSWSNLGLRWSSCLQRYMIPLYFNMEAEKLYLSSSQRIFFLTNLSHLKPCIFS